MRYLLATVLAVVVSGAEAQAICGLRQTFLDSLAKNYAEHPRHIGMAENGSVVEVLVSKNGGWTILVTQPSGKTCMVAVGKSWETLPPPDEGDDT